MFGTTAPAINCQFELERASRIFYSGDQICGKITLSTTKKLFLEGISINLTGLESVQWSENSKVMPIVYDDCTINETKENKVQFKGSKEYVLVSVQLSEAFTMEPGEFVAKFCLNLPDQLLATGRQSNGHVDYNLLVVLQQKTKWKKVFRKKVILRNRLDLNLQEKLKEPHTIQWNLPQNEVSISIPYTGFVPGQFLPISVKMTRLLYKSQIVMNLCQKMSFTSQVPEAKTKEILKVLDSYKISGAKELKLHIPLTTAISTTLEDILMKISYHLEICFLDDKQEIERIVVVPLKIGTVALAGSEKVTGDKTSRLHYYDNLALKEELQSICLKNRKISNFDQVVCEKSRSHQSDEQLMNSSMPPLKSLVRNLRARLRGNAITTTTTTASS